MGFDPYNRSENSGVHYDSNSQSGSSLWSVKIHSLTLSYTPKSMRCDSRASLLAYSLASLYFDREPKAKAVTQHVFHMLKRLSLLG
jgi:hypothetical protein